MNKNLQNRFLRYCKSLKPNNISRLLENHYRITFLICDMGQTRMKNIFASMAVLTSFSQFLCIFCCIVPTATGIITLLSVFGLAGANSMFLGDLSLALHPYRKAIMAASICLISLSWVLWFLTKNKQKIACGCDTKPKKKPVFLMIATALLVVNLGTMPFLH